MKNSNKTIQSTFVWSQSNLAQLTIVFVACNCKLVGGLAGWLVGTLSECHWCHPSCMYCYLCLYQQTFNNWQIVLFVLYQSGHFAPLAAFILVAEHHELIRLFAVVEAASVYTFYHILCPDTLLTSASTWSGSPTHSVKSVRESD